MIELPIEVFAALVVHLPILLSAVLFLLALATYAIYLLLKRIVLWLSAFIELRMYPNRVALNLKVETWQDREATLAAQVRLHPLDEMEHGMGREMEQRQRILNLLEQIQRG
jgi:hypothetical protein